MNTVYQKLSVWCGVMFGTLTFLSLYFLAWFPPPPATLTGEAYMASISEDLNLAKLGVILGILGAMFSLPWNAVLAHQIGRAEGNQPMPFFASMSLGAGTINTVAFLAVPVLFAPIVFRAERDPEIVRMFFDTSWLLAVMVFGGFFIQCCAIAIAGFQDKRSKPVFPRWVCFTMLWMAFGATPGFLAIFFYTGPFSWNGIIAFWTPVAAFSIYLIILIYILLAAIDSQLHEETE